MRWLPAAILICALVLPMARIQSAAAQVSDEGFTGDNTYESLFGYVLTWDDPWVLDDQGSGFYAADLVDSLYLSQDNQTYVSVVARSSIGSLRSSLDFTAEYYGQSFEDSELLEIDSTKDDGHATIRYDQSGDQYGIYIRIFLASDRATEVTVTVGGELSSFDDTVDAVQDAVAIDDEPALGEVDSAGLLDVMEDGDAVPFPTPSDQFESDEPTENDDKKLPDDDDADPTPDGEETEDEEDPADEGTPDDEESTGDDLADLGIIDEGTYESPQYGVELTWPSDWEPAEDAISSSEADGFDQLTVVNAELDSAFYLSVFSIDAVTPVSWSESFQDLAEDEDNGIEILDSSTGNGTEVVLYRTEIGNETWYGLIEVYEDETNDALVVAEVSGSEENVAAAFESVQDDMELNGDAPFRETVEFPELPAD
jgi:hypothetical protein